MSQTLYRAAFATNTGTVRRMTFACAGGIKAAHQFARTWELRDDKLQTVSAVRELARPSFELQSNL